MRGIPSLITDIRKKVFTEVARMAYEGGDYSKAEDLPYIIVPGDRLRNVLQPEPFFGIFFYKCLHRLTSL